jgi:S1-C subfamily serine protease
MLRVMCPHCQTKIEQPTVSANGIVQCWYCRRQLKVPGTTRGAERTGGGTDPPRPAASAPRPSAPTRPAVPPPPPPAQEVRRPSRRDQHDRPGRRRKHAAHSNDAVAWIVGGSVCGLVIIGVIVVLVVVLGANDKQNQIVQNPPPRMPPQGSGSLVRASSPDVPVRPLIESKGPTGSPAPSRPSEEKSRPFGPPSSRAELDPDVVRRIKAATVFLRVEASNGNQFTGSGFFALKRDIIITNAHVVGMKQPQSAEPRQIVVAVNSGEPDEWRCEAKVVAVSKKWDTAALRLRLTQGLAHRLPEPLPVRPANVLETQRVYASGLPLSEKLGVGIKINALSVSSLHKENGVLVAIQLDGALHPGNSGGPILNGDGTVIGIARASGILEVDERSGQKRVSEAIQFAIPSDFILVQELLDLLEGKEGR